MADLIPDRGNERGQLLLIAAFIIATSFVVLALVVNSAIFTENLATRDDVAGSQDALQHRHEVEQSVGAVVEDINGDTSPTISDADDQVEIIGRQGGAQQAVRGRVVDVEFDSIDTGTKIAQDEVGNFSNTTGFVPDWTVAEDVSNTRNFQINLTDNGELQTSANAFQIVVNGSSNNEWTVKVAENSSDPDKVDILVDRPGPPTTQTCTREFDEFLRIDITGASVGGKPCPALDRHSSGTPLWFSSGVDAPYRIDFNSPGEIEGTYSLIVDDGADPHNFLAIDPPYSATAIYNLTVSYSYHTTNVGYETEIRVAPGEVPP
jgi:hypothetical protein